ncbi:hypothetical protein HDU76_006999 [Blyttiomyces sp. JEL0837]|nr:hypothetical protein HDU76_006999 [Blyttiomyces sp. JEL0837]
MFGKHNHTEQQQTTATTTTTHTTTVLPHHANHGATGAAPAPANASASTPLLGYFHRHHDAAHHTTVVYEHVHSEFTRELVQAAGEFFGTFTFLFLSFAAVQAAILHKENFLFSISLSFGLSLALAVWLTYRISGGALNPAVVFGLYLLQKIPTRKAALYIAAELLGAYVAALTVSIVVPNSWGASFKGANEIFAGTTYFQGFFLEALLTAGLMLSVLFFAVEKSKATPIAPLLIGLYVFVAHLISIPYTNTSLNPARTFGSALVTGDFSAHWLFWLAPLSGSAIAAVVYKFFKHFHYESLNLGQEDDHVVVVGHSLP